MNQKQLIISLGVVLSITMLFAVRGCGRYGEVNQETYAYAKALYSVCNRHDSARLQVCSDMIDSAAAAEEISRTESRWLEAIIAEAKAERWDEAQVMTRQLMSDQADR